MDKVKATYKKEAWIGTVLAVILILSMAALGLETVFIAGMFFVLGLGALYAGIKKYLHVQKISITPTSTVRGAAVGQVELYGKARSSIPALLSPISQQRCVCWRLIAKASKHRSSEIIYEEHSPDNFYLEDETGKIIIKYAGTVVSGHPKKIFQGKISTKKMLEVFPEFRKKDQSFLDYLEKQPAPIKKKYLPYEDKNIVVMEYYLPEGDQIYVLGSAVPAEGEYKPVAHGNLIVINAENGNTPYIKCSSECRLIQNEKIIAFFFIYFGVGVSIFSLLFMLIALGLS